MKITPLEIRQKTFEKKSFGGYDKDEVQAYLISLSQAWERLLDENKEMRIRLETADREVQKLREVESSLFKTLKTAEDTGANLIDQASKTAALNLREAQIKAESLIKDAKWQAKNIIEDAERQAKGIEIEYKTIENARDNFLAELRNLANDLLEKAERTQHKAQQSHYSASPRPDLETFKAQIREVAEPTPPPIVEENIPVPPQPTPEPVAIVEEIKPVTFVAEPKSEPPTHTSSDAGSFFDQIG